MNCALQPFQYQGSKRVLAARILEHVPKGRFDEMLEPFAGSAAVSLAAIADGVVSRVWLNDINEPLIRLWRAIVGDTDALISEYAVLWEQQIDDPASHFLRVRDEFNRSRQPAELLYLLARSVKGAVRYNIAGEFNQSADRRRLGTKPQTTAARLRRISRLIGSRCTLTSLDCVNLLEHYREGQVWYLDPPYEGTSEGPNGRYYQSMPRTQLIEFLGQLRASGVPFVLSYDGFTGDRRYGTLLPDDLGLTHHYVDAGTSSTSSLQQRREITTESLYVSPELAAAAPVLSRTSSAGRSEDAQLKLPAYA